MKAKFTVKHRVRVNGVRFKCTVPNTVTHKGAGSHRKTFKGAFL